ncbi:30S ribosomal protein S5 [Candidatus Marinamargulisbacteria bacterium SCGC AG-410-N11]|nr:30S ribosomal protein S5 [Candidatus Marinamargulisbacteria bacterium SCGC AG-410-N11]
MNDKKSKVRERNSSKDLTQNDNLEKVIRIDRVNKVVKGGKRLAFRAFVITGDKKGNVGYGIGKSREVPVAIKQGIDKSNKSFKRVNIVSGTLPHIVEGRFASTRVIIKPAKPGTGVIAGGAVRIILEAAGIKDVVAKAIGSRNVINMTKAVFNGLSQLKDLKTEELKRGKKLPVYVKKENGEDK